MKQILTVLMAGVLSFSAVRADGGTNAPAPAAAPTTTTMPVVEAVIALDPDTKPTDTFSPSAPQLNAFFQTAGTHKGDKLRGVWIATDVGTAAPPNTKIGEATMDGPTDDFHGAFTLTKPSKGWPPGQYRVEFYLNDALVTTATFTIDASKASDNNP